MFTIVPVAVLSIIITVQWYPNFISCSIFPDKNLINSSAIQSTSEQSGSSTDTLTYEGFDVLDALAVTVRSMHNCRVFGFYGGVQKLTALMKGTSLLFWIWSFYQLMVNKETSSSNVLFYALLGAVESFSSAITRCFLQMV